MIIIYAHAYSYIVSIGNIGNNCNDCVLVIFSRHQYSTHQFLSQHKLSTFSNHSLFHNNFSYYSIDSNSCRRDTACSWVTPFTSSLFLQAPQACRSCILYCNLRQYNISHLCAFPTPYICVPRSSQLCVAQPPYFLASSIIFS